MSYMSPLAARLSPYVAGEQPKDKRYIKLNTNENPYPPAPGVLAAVQGAVPDLALYPDPECTKLRAAIAAVDGVSPEQVFCGNGSDEVLAFAFAAFFSGKKLVAPDITYSFYPVYANLFDVDYVRVPLLEDFSVDVDGLMQDAGIALCNPNAPTGMLLPMADVRRLAEYTRERGEVLLVDEAYAAFAPENARPLLEEFDNVLIVRTFSKSHSLAGLRVGYCMGSTELIAAMNRVRDSFNSYPVDRLAQAAAAVSIADTEYARSSVEKIVSARDNTAKALRDHGFTVLPSATNFLFVRAAELDATPVYTALRDRGILVRHFTSPRLNAWLRISVGTQEDMDAVVRALCDICG